MNWYAKLRALPKNGPARTLIVAFIVSVFSAAFVAGTAILLRPQYQSNQELNRRENILAAANLLVPGAPVEELFAQIEPRVVDLETGDYAREIDPESLVRGAAASEAATSVPVPDDLDIAFINERPRYAVVYLVRDAGELTGVVLPVYGYGLWSTMRGYVALAADANTVIGLRFYEHGETPGLGGEIDDPGWQAQWRGKQIYNDSGDPIIEVLKGRAAPASAADPRAAYQVDGITGATMTGRGVTNLLRFWLGDLGFGPYLQTIRDSNGEAR